MNILLLSIPSVIYLLILAAITFYIIKHRESGTTNRFAKGFANYKAGIIFFTLAATFVGPAYSLGVVNQTYSLGFGFSLIYMLAVVHLLLTGIYLLRLKDQGRFKNIRATGNLMENVFGKTGRFVLGVFVVAQYTALVSILAVGGATVLDVVFGMPRELTIFLIAIIVATYSFSCGMIGVLRTDVIQFCFLVVIGLVALVGTAMVFFGPKQVGVIEPAAPSEVLTATQWWSFAVAFVLGEALQPFYLNRVFMAQSAKDAGRGFIGTAVFGLVWFTILGVFGVLCLRVISAEAQTQGIFLQAIPVLFGDSVLATMVMGLLAAAFLGVVMSTLDSILNAGAVSFVDDLYCSFGNMEDEDRLPVMRIAIVVMAISGALLGSFGGNIVQLLIFAYTLWVPTIVPPLALAFFWPQVGRRPGWVMLIPTALGGLVTFLVPEAITNAVPAIVLGLVANVVLLGVLVRVSQPKE